MKKFSLTCLFLTLCLCLNGFIFVSSAPASAAVLSKPSEIGVATARFENMLNMNFVYGDDFCNNESLVNAAAISVLGEVDDDGFIPSDSVTAFIKDFYDIDMVITKNINSSLPQRDGFVYVVPRGYTTYEHDVVSVIRDGDYYSVVSSVKINLHTGESYIATANSVFMINHDSSFGYSLISSELDVASSQSI